MAHALVWAKESSEGGAQALPLAVVAWSMTERRVRRTPGGGVQEEAMFVTTDQTLSVTPPHSM
jgi:hypothetical protein